MFTRTDGAPHGAQTKNSHEMLLPYGPHGTHFTALRAYQHCPRQSRPRWYVAQMPELRGTVVLATYNSGDSVVPVLAEIEEAASVLRRSGVDLGVALVDVSSEENVGAIATDGAPRRVI